MGFWGLSLAGAGFICIGIWQAFSTAKIYLNGSRSSLQSSSIYRKRPYYTAELAFIAGLATLFIVNGVLTSIRGLENGDHLGLAIQLEKSGVASIFLLYSIVSIVSECTQLLPLPWEACNLIALLAFGEEFLVFYLQKEGSTGLESFSMGLILQGTWFIQMGISFFTGWIVHGCKISEKVGGDYTIHCDSHAHGHRGKAIATLQFNCHLALLLISLLTAYSYLSTKYVKSDAMNYKPLGEHSEELQDLDVSNVEIGSRFALESDDDETDEAPLHNHKTMSEINGIDQVSV
ncbi:uncharacterized protein LOC131031377 [Cryptomeria japonica]|uniref:uncharacterized protein LOC131031377 n=1 Tax=Cryptomeria japonica TaxID=3369 RepID=UPI0025ABD617|nr:uncharacterized protein LOC131031377 [Cryptomeria japonica]